MTEFVVTKVRRVDEGDRHFWRARVNGVEVHNMFGSWFVDGEPRRHLLPAPASAVNAKVRKLEGRERRATRATLGR